MLGDDGLTWTVPREWGDETCFILGGGESLKEFDAEILRGEGRVVAIKEAGLTLCPWADVLYWADKHWCDGNNRLEPNAPRFHLHTGKYKITRAPADKAGHHDVKVVRFNPKLDFSTDPAQLAGVDSGSNAINLAALFGAKRIILLGFDMHGDNWDGRARDAHKDGSYKTRFMPSIARMAVPLQKMGVEVLNATPKTALGCFPLVKLEDVLAKRGRPRKSPEPEIFTPAEDYADGESDAGGDIELVVPLERGEDGRVAIDEEAPAPQLVEGDGPVDHYGLEMYRMGPDLLRAIAALGANDTCFINIRLRGSDVITQRPTYWWRLQLSRSFAQILEHQAPANMVRFECRRTLA